jgi:hypothetical protein
MVAGAIVGGYLGARVALDMQPRYMKLVISAIGLALVAYFFLRRRQARTKHPSAMTAALTALGGRQAFRSTWRADGADWSDEGE